MTDYRFKLGMFTSEMQLPYHQAFPKAKEIGAEYVYYAPGPGDISFEELTPQEADRIGACIDENGLRLFLLCTRKFKQVHLTDLNVEDVTDHPQFQSARTELIQTMQVATQLQVPGVSMFTFAWPGEYTAGKPTWPMRWMTRGGIISELDMEKLVQAFTLLAQDAEQHGIDLVLSMMPWNYTNTTEHMRQVIEAVGSSRLKVMWGPADNINCGEADTVTRGFYNIRPYLYGLHIKDLRVINGLTCDFEYCPIGEGDVDFLTVLRNLRDYRCDAVISIATHFTPPGGTGEDAMRINFNNMTTLIKQVEQDAD